MDMKEIANMIENLRIRSGMSKASLAKKLGVMPITVANWINGVSLPTVQYIESICQATGVTVEQFFSGLSRAHNNDEQDKFVDEWRMLNDEQKSVVDSAIEAFIAAE